MPGFSWHQYGLAVDLVFDSDPVKPGLQATWDGKFPWKSMGKAGEFYGLEWAGSWKSFPEFPHFQKTWGLQLGEARELFEIGGLQAVWNALNLTRQTL
jgi:peptidoglycan L-alanyl-D-glutamate endopeptidase CwlK